jgi:hypothetical protein
VRTWNLTQVFLVYSTTDYKLHGLYILHWMSGVSVPCPEDVLPE